MSPPKTPAIAPEAPTVSVVAGENSTMNTEPARPVTM